MKQAAYPVDFKPIPGVLKIKELFPLTGGLPKLSIKYQFFPLLHKKGPEVRKRPARIVALLYERFNSLDSVAAGWDSGSTRTKEQAITFYFAWPVCLLQ